MKSLNIIFPEQMLHFYESYNITKGGMPGGDFDGPTCNRILREDHVVNLAQILGQTGEIWISYLRSIREVNRRLAMRELSVHTHDAIKVFQDCFDVVNAVPNGVSETLKDCYVYFIITYFSTFLVLF